ncbi:MAG: Coenzyme F420 hydrogenase/dehydrogenase, beta subunit C-terminal domain [Candidatus Thorarchaeota archaeon]
MKSRDWLKENSKVFAFKKLEREIIKSGVCVECGTCVSNCPDSVLSGERSSGIYVPTLVGKCSACGICYAMCPQTSTLNDDLIGQFRSIWKVQASIDGTRKQNGGAVTALLLHALSKSTIDGAVVASQDPSKPWFPTSKVVDSESDVKTSGGTVYTRTPVVEALMKGFRDGKKNLAIVGMTCSFNAVTRLLEHPAGVINLDNDAEVLRIGLFCMKAYNYNELVQFFSEKKFDIADIEKMSIAKGQFKIQIKDEIHEWPLAELEHLTSRSCSFCGDLTCKSSDISCGNIGSDDDWSTVIIRSDKGEKLFKSAMKQGIFTAEPMEEKAIGIIGNVARSKANRIYKYVPNKE